METERVPSFTDLMEDWCIEFNASHSVKMFYHDFTTAYLCMKIKRNPDEPMEDHVCIGHLFVGRTTEGNGVEIGTKGGETEFLRPEDPEFFTKLLKRVDEKLDG